MFIDIRPTVPFRPSAYRPATDELDRFRPTSPGETPPVLPDTEQAQLAALHDLSLDSAKRRQFDEASQEVAQVFDAPIALVSFVDEVHQPQPDASGLVKDAQVPPHQESLDVHVIAANEVLVSEDVTEDPRFADDPRVLEKGIRFYAGGPLRTSTGLMIGTLCVIDIRPRNFPGPNRRRLQDMADKLMSQIERRSAYESDKAEAHLITGAGIT